jgi:acetyltransferase-like isoleucine patch superfamily enzyme
METRSPQIGEFCTISPDVEFGDQVTVHGFANLYGCRIGDRCCIGTFVEIQRDTNLGKGVKVQSHTFICSNTDIEDDVFIGHNVSFINDRYPTSAKAESGSWKAEGVLVRRGATIGTGAVILCGIEIGEGSVIGAGSVVTSNVAPHTIVAGVPAKTIRKLKLEEQGMGGQPNEN